MKSIPALREYMARPIFQNGTPLTAGGTFANELDEMPALWRLAFVHAGNAPEAAVF